MRRSTPLPDRHRAEHRRSHIGFVGQVHVHVAAEADAGAEHRRVGQLLASEQQLDHVRIRLANALAVIRRRHLAGRVHDGESAQPAREPGGRKTFAQRASAGYRPAMRESPGSGAKDARRGLRHPQDPDTQLRMPRKKPFSRRPEGSYFRLACSRVASLSPYACLASSGVSKAV